MKSENVKPMLVHAKMIQNEASRLKLWLPRAEGMAARGEMILPKSFTHKTRTYIERTADQINGAYENGLYDACAVMIRRLIETLIIEVFEYHQITAKIKDSNGEFYHLSGLVPLTINESKWNLGRNAKQALPRLKDLGDKSAHSRRFIAHRTDIDKTADDLRVVVQELLTIAGLK